RSLLDARRVVGRRVRVDKERLSGIDLALPLLPRRGSLAAQAANMDGDLLGIGLRPSGPIVLRDASGERLPCRLSDIDQREAVDRMVRVDLIQPEIRVGVVELRDVAKRCR